MLSLVITLVALGTAGMLGCPPTSPERDALLDGAADRFEAPSQHASPDALQSERAQKVDPAVHRALERGGGVFVVIALAGPSNLERLDLSTRRREISRLQDRILRELAPTEFRLVKSYEAIPALVGWVTADGLAKLVAHAEVSRVDLDVRGTGKVPRSTDPEEASNSQEG